jgi:glycine/D-amino acid oxidase-like deaminating enzyme
LRFPAGVVSPYNLITGTFNALLHSHESRLTIDTKTPVVQIAYDPSSNEGYPYTVITSRGSVKAANVIHCTNGYTGHLVPGLRGKMYPRRGTMSVQAPGASFPNISGKQSWSFYLTPKHHQDEQSVETGRYYGFQNRDTGEVWIGGDRDSVLGFISTDDTKIDTIAEANLRNVLPRLFSKAWVPAQPEVRNIWTGVMCYTGDQLPLVGRLPTSATHRLGQGEWIAAGWNTYGMTNGFLCGDALGKMILGEDVSSWFPGSYLPSEERLSGKKFRLEAVLKDFFTRIGAHGFAQTLGKEEARESKL